MLVLTRKLNEEIVIGGDITIRVVAIDRGKTRLAIVAPREIPIWRKEIMPEQSIDELPPTVAVEPEVISREHARAEVAAHSEGETD